MFADRHGKVISATGGDRAPVTGSIWKEIYSDSRAARVDPRCLNIAAENTPWAPRCLRDTGSTKPPTITTMTWWHWCSCLYNRRHWFLPVKVSTGSARRDQERRMPFIAANGFPGLTSCAICLDPWVPVGAVDSAVHLVQQLELPVGAVNLAFMGTTYVMALECLGAFVEMGDTFQVMSGCVGLMPR